MAGILRILVLFITGSSCAFAGLVLEDVLRSQAIGRAVKVLGEALDEANVTLCGSLRVMTSLEFLQGDFA